MKQLKNYQNYSVTKEGTVINNKTNRELKPINGSDGYYYVGLSNKSKVKRFAIHRIVASAFLSNDENKREVNHINGIKTDNRLENIEWVTPSENMKHAYKFGLKIANRKTINNKFVLDTETGIFYNSAREASRLLGINENTLRGYLTGINPNKTSLIYA
jgi:hypothetical protein